MFSFLEVGHFQRISKMGSDQFLLTTSLDKIMYKAEFLESTQKLIAAKCFTGRHSELERSMSIFCDALANDTTITQSLSAQVSNWGALSKSEENMTIDEAWEFLYKDIGNLSHIYKLVMRAEILAEFKKNPDSYSATVKALWLTVFSELNGPCETSNFRSLNLFLVENIDYVKPFAYLTAQALRDKNHGFNVLNSASFFENLGEYLKPRKATEAAQMSSKISESFQFFKSIRTKTVAKFYQISRDIAYDFKTGTNCIIKPTSLFNQWYGSIPIKKSIDLKMGYKLFKIDENNLVIAKGSNTPGIRLIKEGQSFIICNNIVADKKASEEAKNSKIKDIQGLTTELRTEFLVSMLDQLSLIIHHTEQAIMNISTCCMQ